MLYKQKIFSLVSSAVVLDVNNNIIYRNKGTFLSLSHKKRIYKGRHRIFTIKRKLFTFVKDKCYIYDQNGEKIGQMAENITSRVFTMESSDGTSYSVDGKFFNRHSSIRIDNEVVANIELQFSFIGNHYRIEVLNEKHIDMIICLVSAIHSLKIR